MAIERGVAWRQALGAGILLGLAIGCFWLAWWTRMPWTRSALLAAALTLGLLAALSGAVGQPWARRWERRLDFRFGPGAVPFLALVVLLALAAFLSGNNLLYLVVATLLAGLLVSGLASALNLSGMALRFRHPDEIFAGEAAPVELTLVNHKRWWPSYSLRVAAASQAVGPGRNERAEMPPVYFAAVTRRGSARAAAQLRFPRRGRYSSAAFTLATRFPFGLVHKRRHFETTAAESDLLVYPQPAAVPVGPDLLAWLGAAAERQRRGDGQELYRIRPHRPGDSARSVHWKASARALALRVREFSQPGAWRVELRLALPPRADAALAERALSLAAGLTLALAETDTWVALRGDHPMATPQGPSAAGAWLPPLPAHRQRRAILEYLALAMPELTAEAAAPDEPGDCVVVDLAALARDEA